MPCGFESRRPHQMQSVGRRGLTPCRGNPCCAEWLGMRCLPLFVGVRRWRMRRRLRSHNDALDGME